MIIKDISGGVISNHSTSYLIEDIMTHGIDIDFIAHEKECINEYHDDCYYNDCPTYIIGFKKNESGQYEIDESAEYSAILNESTCQVVHSQYYSMCRECSPCYPLQNDLDTAGDHKTYQLPPDLFDDEFDEHLEIFEINKE